MAAIDVVTGMFPDKQKDFVLHISETDIVVVKEVKAGSEVKDLIKIATSIEETLLSELSVKCLIGHRLGVLADEGHRQILQGSADRDRSRRGIRYGKEHHQL